MQLTNQNGWIECICGSMFSGKSEELIRRVRSASFGKQKIQVFKPAIDNRYSETAVVSHTGNQVQALSLSTSEEIMNAVENDTQVVAIDEVQFFDDEIVDAVQELANRGIRVIIAGLDMDFRGEPFHPVPALMAISETITKLNAVCVVCSSPASRTQRLINNEPASYDDPIILVGASESYEARCRHCHQVSESRIGSTHA